MRCRRGPTRSTKEQTAITQLSALLAATRYITDNLGKADVFQNLKVTSGNDSVVSATVTGTPAAGVYQVTPLRTAQSAQFLSSGVASDTDRARRGHAHLPLRQ